MVASACSFIVALFVFDFAATPQCVESSRPSKEGGTLLSSLARTACGRNVELFSIRADFRSLLPWSKLMLPFTESVSRLWLARVFGNINNDVSVVDRARHQRYHQ